MIGPIECIQCYAVNNFRLFDLEVKKEDSWSALITCNLCNVSFSVSFNDTGFFLYDQIYTIINKTILQKPSQRLSSHLAWAYNLSGNGQYDFSQRVPIKRF